MLTLPTDTQILITRDFDAPEVGGRTTLTQLTQVSNRKVRDMIIESGMEAGMQDAMDLLEHVAVSLK